MIKIFQNSQDVSRRGVIIFFVLILFIGLWAGTAYSKSTDEDSEYSILKSNVAEYVLQIFGEDHPLYRKLGTSPISQSIEKDHGVAAYIPILPILYLAKRISRYYMMQLWHGWTFILFMLGVVAVYRLAREAFQCSRKAGCAAVLLYYLTPRMFAEGHYNNKDMVLVSFILLTLWLGVRLVRLGRIRDAVFFSIAGAFAANVKIIGAWFWGLMGLLFLFSRIFEKRLDRNAWRVGLIAIGTFVVSYLLITPAMWSDPVGNIVYILNNATHFSRWQAFILFEGSVISAYIGEVPPWYYIPKLMVMTIPVCIQLLAGIGFVYWMKNGFSLRFRTYTERNRFFFLLVVLVGCVVPLLVGMFSKMLVYNGWRHFFFLYVGVILFSIYGMICLGKIIPFKRIGALGLAVYFCFQGTMLIVNHPLQASYYNPIAAPFVENNYETDYWFLSLGKTIDCLQHNADRNQELELSFTTNSLIGGMIELSNRALHDSPAHYTSDIEHANYYVAFLSYEQLFERIPDDVFSQFIEHLHKHYGPEIDTAAFRELFTIKAYGIPIVTVYERT